MVGRNRAGSHGSATVEPHTLYFPPVYYSMQRGVNTCDKTATMPRNSELVEAMIPALRGRGESWKISRYGQTLPCQTIASMQPNLLPRWQPNLQLESPFLWPMLSMCSSPR